jgi:hypothetical protein
VRGPLNTPILVAAALALGAGRAAASDFFGPMQGAQLAPELDLFASTGEHSRFIAKLMPTITPSTGNWQAGYGVYGNWFVAPMVSDTITPDLLTRRRLDVRLGVEWYPTREIGSSEDSDFLLVEGEGTPRLILPLHVLGSVRSRVEARWQLAAPTSFAWRLRVRPQLEREFSLPWKRLSAVTPFANAEFIWSTKRDMWDQFRIQAGLDFAAYWFGKGQVLEVNFITYTNLQPSRSTTPALGVVWMQYL